MPIESDLILKKYFYGDFQNCIVSLMKLSPNKRPYYRKGIRAMELDMSAL